MKTHKRPRTHLTARDIDMLESLATGRFLTAQALEWLHFPDWRTRWEKMRTSQRHYYPAPRLYGRLRRLEAERLIHRIVRPVSLVASNHHRDENAYALARGGAEILAEARGISIDMVPYEELRERSVQNQTHSVLIGQFYAALRAKIEAMHGLTFEAWQGDHLLARNNYDRIAVKVRSEQGGTRIEQLPVLPDATCVLRHPGGAVRIFVELDRGRPIRTWKEKITAYQAYAGSPELNKRYGVSQFLLLTATTSDSYRRQLLQATAEVVGQPSDRYLFTLIGDLHPLTIGHSWMKIGAVTPALAHTVGGQRTSYTIQETAHVFLR
jgi:hypothetical protein